MPKKVRYPTASITISSIRNFPPERTSFGTTMRVRRFLLPLLVGIAGVWMDFWKIFCRSVGSTAVGKGGGGGGAAAGAFVSSGTVGTLSWSTTSTAAAGLSLMMPPPMTSSASASLCGCSASGGGVPPSPTLASCIGAEWSPSEEAAVRAGYRRMNAVEEETPWEERTA